MVRLKQVLHVLFEIFLEISLLAKLEDKIVVVGCLEGLIQFDNINMLYLLNYHNLFCYQFLLLFRHWFNFDHFDGIFLEFPIFAALKDLACGSRAYLLY